MSPVTYQCHVYTTSIPLNPASVHIHTVDILYHFFCIEIRVETDFHRKAFNSAERDSRQFLDWMVICSEAISCQLAPSPPTQLLGQSTHMHIWYRGIVAARIEKMSATLMCVCASLCVCVCVLYRKQGQDNMRKGWRICVHMCVIGTYRQR